MSYFGTTDFLVEVSKGNIPGHSLVQKFGASNLTTALAPITQTSVYQVPTTPQSLELVSDNAGDNAAGAGAREVSIEYIDLNWDAQTQLVVPTGLVGAALGSNALRIYRWYVSQSGTYATSAAGSHLGNLTIQAAGGGAAWTTIVNTPFPTGQSQIGVYTLPRNKRAYLLSKNIFTDTSKTADVYFFQRPNADDVAVPYTGTMRLFEREVGTQGGYNLITKAPKGPIYGPADMGFMGKVSSGTAECSVEYELLVIDDGF